VKGPSYRLGNIRQLSEPIGSLKTIEIDLSRAALVLRCSDFRSPRDHLRHRRLVQSALLHGLPGSVLVLSVEDSIWTGSTLISNRIPILWDVRQRLSTWTPCSTAWGIIHRRKWKSVLPRIMLPKSSSHRRRSLRDHHCRALPEPRGRALPELRGRQCRVSSRITNLRVGNRRLIRTTPR
jgi:hypothetical protein